MTNRHGYAKMRRNADASAIYTKMGNGEWACWTDLECRPGQRITVTARSGNTRLEKLIEKIASNGECHLWRIEQRGEIDG